MMNKFEIYKQHYKTLLKHAAITLDIEVGDILLGGKFKNRRVEVKEIGKNELGQPTINGKNLLSFYIEKQLPEERKSSQTREETE